MNFLYIKLKWPDDQTDLDSWRTQWSSAFTLRHRQVITTSKELAIRLAELARKIRKRANLVLAVETKRGSFRQLHAAFKEALVHDLTDDGFADMYAQTVTYGLLTARVSRPAGLVAEDLPEMAPVTNPFLKELLGTFINIGGRKKKIDFDELGINDVVELLRQANMDAVMRDFGNRNPNEDPVIHFYELFLKEYDAKEKVKRGVFYTPLPVVSFIVRSVDELLKTEFGLEDGLADTTTWGELQKRKPEIQLPKHAKPETPFVQILDFATGTGTFMVQVIEIIHKTMSGKWEKAGYRELEIAKLWDEYVPKHLLPRLYGFELMMAPYAIAHMKIGLKLWETGYRFRTEERVRLYLTNTLEEPKDFSQQIEMFAPALAHEAKEANKVKAGVPITVVIGNPPYAGHSSNKGGWITQLIDTYYYVDNGPLGEKNPKWLQDDYVKFTRFSQHILSLSGIGICGYITNHGYIDNPTFRGMRQSLLKFFSNINIFDLHGNYTKGETCPDGTLDENVFDIKQGVAIFTASIDGKKGGACKIKHASLWGLRSHKYTRLLEENIRSIDCSMVDFDTPFYLFMPQNQDLRTEYNSYLPITSILPVNVLGFQTHRDNFAIDFDKKTLVNRIHDFCSSQHTEAVVKKLFEIEDASGWTVNGARKTLRAAGQWKKDIVPCSYRPFDRRFCCFNTIVMDRPRRELIDNVKNRDNLCLGIGRQGIAVQDPIWSLITISKDPIDANIFRRGGVNVFPLYLYQNQTGLQLFKGRTLNIPVSFQSLFGSLYSLSGNDNVFTKKPEQIVAYIYGLSHSIKYRTRYSDFLKIDFPKLPMPKTLVLFESVSKLGEKLIEYHLLNPASFTKSQLQSSAKFYDSGFRDIASGYPKYENRTVFINPNESGFKGVPEEVWNFHIGGYQVCEKWLKDRRGRTLSDEDIEHYQKIVVAIKETIRLMGEIDKVIEEHGGFPGAFVTDPKVIEEAKAKAKMNTAKT